MRHLKFLVAMMLFAFAFNSGAAVNKKTEQKQKNTIVQKAKTVAVQVPNRTTATVKSNKNDGLTVKLKRATSGKKLVDSSSPKITGTVANKQVVKSSNAPLSVTFASKEPTANTGKSSCPYKNAAVTPWTKDGALTPANKQTTRTAPMAYDARGTTGIN